jgi:hypothetical protein
MPTIHKNTSVEEWIPKKIEGSLHQKLIISSGSVSEVPEPQQEEYDNIFPTE